MKRQCVTRTLFQFSRRERELLSFDLVFETRTGISFFQSRASRREREFFSSISCFETRTGISFLNLGLRDENEKFYFSISDFETRTRIEIMKILARIFENIRTFYTHLKNTLILFWRFTFFVGILLSLVNFILGTLLGVTSQKNHPVFVIRKRRFFCHGLWSNWRCPLSFLFKCRYRVT